MDNIKEVLGLAPGKLILCGEHAVVHGSTALAASLGLYTQVRIQTPTAGTDPDGHLTLKLKDLNVHFTWPVKSVEAAFKPLEEFVVDPLCVKSCSADIMQCIASLVDEQEFPEAVIGVSAFLFLYISIVGFKSATVIVSSELPLGSGLGSSAAFCVAISGAVLALSGALDLDALQGSWLSLKQSNREIVNKWAFEGEKIIHGRPSGIDNTVSAYGNLVKFKSGHLTHIQHIFPIRMLITNTKVGRNTKALVAGVAERASRHPKAMSAVFDAVNAISEEMSEIIQAPFSDDASITAQEGKLEELMEMNQGLLQCMGVCHPAIKQVLQTTSRYKLYSKLTGAGGGGCVLTLLPKLLSGKTVEKVKVDLESQGFQCFLATIGGEGVQVSFQCSSS